MNASPISTYDHRIENIPPMTIFGTGGTMNYYYLKDLANTVLALANSSGSIVESYLYDAYGTIDSLIIGFYNALHNEGGPQYYGYGGRLPF